MKFAVCAAIYARASESAEFDRDIRQKIFRTRRGRAYRLIYTLIGSDVQVLRVRGSGKYTFTTGL